MNKIFSEYVTNTAFSITLSKNMVRLLVAIGTGKDIDTGRWVCDAQALQRRGLVKHVHPNVGTLHCHELTKEGKLVLELVRLAGLKK